MAERLRVDRAEISLGGSGNITAAGSARSLKVSMGGSSSSCSRRSARRQRRMSAAGSSGIRATVDGPANVSVVGSGTVDLGSGAHCTVSRMGKAQSALRIVAG